MVFGYGRVAGAPRYVSDVYPEMAGDAVAGFVERISDFRARGEMDGVSDFEVGVAPESEGNDARVEIPTVADGGFAGGVGLRAVFGQRAWFGRGIEGDFDLEAGVSGEMGTGGRRE